MNFKKKYLFLLLVFTQFSYSQEGIAVYSDYLTDNLYFESIIVLVVFSLYLSLCLSFFSKQLIHSPLTYFFILPFHSITQRIKMSVFPNDNMQNIHFVGQN